ncbi:MAG: hypothetical protein AAFP79_00675 [Pseudomonadota bacterium]
MIKKLKSVFYFVRAGDAFDHKDFELARARIDNAIMLAGGSDARNNLFEYFLRAAWIERRFCKDKSSERLQEARRRIEATSTLKVVDRDYLISFCDIFDAELHAINAPQPRLAKSEWGTVKPHYRRDYPLD